jgi:hypothetical protein
VHRQPHKAELRLQRQGVELSVGSRDSVGSAKAGPGFSEAQWCGGIATWRHRGGADRVRLDSLRNRVLVVGDSVCGARESMSWECGAEMDAGNGRMAADP